MVHAVSTESPPWVNTLSRFEQQAALTPDDIAVIAGDERLTYSNLDAAATRVAERVRDANAASAVVGVDAGLGVHLLPALLGAWKASCSWVPVDLTHPSDRVQYILRDATASALLTSAQTGVNVESLTLDHAQKVRAPGEPGAVAYVMYTSGSTGRPKGVIVAHRALASYLSWAVSAYPGLAGQSIVHSTICFDLTITGLFGPLMTGGAVRLAPLSVDISDRPTFLKVTPSHLPLLQAVDDAASPTVDLVVGGEALAADLLSGWRARNPGVRVTNEYGPTEVTVGCVALTLEPGAPVPVDSSGGVVIGRAVPGHFTHVLDADRLPVAEGKSGELHVAGPQVSEGYVSGESASFTDSPFDPGERMYATGDLVRRRSDGHLEYLGRSDNQIKLRGYRIEPGEVETQLRRQPGVEQAVVTAVDGRLVAYTVGPGVVDRQALESLLPEHLIPQAFIGLDSLPLTHNGKLDRSALPAPVFSSSDNSEPRTELEQLIAEIFTDVLGLESIGVEQDFFSMGGNSLTAIRVVARIHEALEVTIPVRAIFDFTTAATLATETERLILAEIDELSDEDAELLLREDVK